MMNIQNYIGLILYLIIMILKFIIINIFLYGNLCERKFENDSEALNKIKNKLPYCYICNEDGKVIVGNK